MEMFVGWTQDYVIVFLTILLIANRKTIEAKEK